MLLLPIEALSRKDAREGEKTKKKVFSSFPSVFVHTAFTVVSKVRGRPCDDEFFMPQRASFNLDGFVFT